MKPGGRAGGYLGPTKVSLAHMIFGQGPTITPLPDKRHPLPDYYWSKVRTTYSGTPPEPNWRELEAMMDPRWPSPLVTDPCPQPVAPTGAPG